MSRREYHRAGCRAVLLSLASGQWIGLAALCAQLGLSQTGGSSRIRDLRKRPWNLTVETRPAKRPGPWEYRVDANAASRALKGLK